MPVHIVHTRGIPMAVQQNALLEEVLDLEKSKGKFMNFKTIRGFKEVRDDEGRVVEEGSPDSLMAIFEGGEEVPLAYDTSKPSAASDIKTLEAFRDQIRLGK